MKLILVSMQYDYGDEKRGISLEHYYFYEPLKNLGIDVVHFDFFKEFKSEGKEKMNEALILLAKQEMPDLILVVPYTDQFFPTTIQILNTFTKTIVYYFDDVWRIDFSKYWSGYFNYATTSDINGVKTWEMRGCSNFTYSPFGCNTQLFRKKNLQKKYDVSFVGSYHPYREWIINCLRKKGIEVAAFGHGWPNGRLNFEEMVNVFNESKININLSNNESFDLRYVFSFQGGIKKSLKLILRIFKALRRNNNKTKEMVKARHFEINACGGFQLSFYVEGLEEHYKLRDEINIYESIDDLADKISYYLQHESEREEIAQRAYQKTINQHTMEKRLTQLFCSLGFDI